MRHHTHVALLATLVSATAFAQDINVYSTTLAQSWKQDTPGFDKTTLMPVTQFLGIDANRLGVDALSLHLYGWGRTDLKDQSAIGGKNTGDLTYGYLQYSFDRANAEIKAGRIVVNQGIGNEMVDGVSMRTDLRNGFTLSAFGGQPVIFKNLSGLPQLDQPFQRDFIVGTRLGWRMARLGEIGVSYLQDGSTAAKDLPVPNPVDYTRRQVGADITLAPAAFLDFSGRTVFDVASHSAALPGQDRSNIAEHDYKATGRILDNLSVTGSYAQRNFYAYYAGTTLPSLFNQNEKGKFSSNGVSVSWSPLGFLNLVADLRTTKRETYGNTTRAGLDGRLTFAAQHLVLGGGYHKVNAFKVKLVDSLTPAYSVSHSEMRAWAMYEKGAFSASLDAIRLHYEGADQDPNLNRKANESEIVGSLGYQATKNFKISGDMSFADTPLYKKQVMGLLRADFRFGFAGKGGK